MVRVRVPWVRVCVCVYDQTWRGDKLNYKNNEERQDSLIIGWMEINYGIYEYMYADDGCLGLIGDLVEIAQAQMENLQGVPMVNNIYSIEL